MALCKIQEDLTPQLTTKLIDAFKKGERPKPGPQSGRHTSENSAGLTALTEKVNARVVRILVLLSDIDCVSLTVLENTAHPSSNRYFRSLLDCDLYMHNSISHAPLIAGGIPGFETYTGPLRRMRVRIQK